MTLSLLSLFEVFLYSEDVGSGKFISPSILSHGVEYNGRRFLVLLELGQTF
jgi:hypothetical protein